MPASDLHALQTWMLRIVTHPDGVRPGFEAARDEGLLPAGVDDITDLVPGNDDVDAFHQLHIYAYAYFSRQIEVMEEEYPSVQHLYGEDRFAALCRRYLIENPSRSYSLDKLSRRFPDWLRAVDGWEHTAFAADLAAVERLMENLWDYPFQDRVSREALAAVPMDGWADVRLVFIDAFEVLALGHHVGPYMNGVKEDFDVEVTDPDPSWMAVYRRGYQVWRMSLTREQALLVDALRQGKTLGEALESVALLPDVAMGDIIGNVGDWFQEWTGEGWFTAIQ